MNELYKKGDSLYDKMISYHDNVNNLGRTMHELFDFEGKVIYEAGVGTGRVTKRYIDEVLLAHCSDKYSSMIDIAKNNLEQYSDKICFFTQDNMNLKATNSMKCDLFIEGWSFGHSILDEEQEVEEIVDTLMKGAFHCIKDDGHMMFIETLGVNTIVPKDIHPRMTLFFELLCEKYGFEKKIIRTDFVFPSVDEAVNILCAYFGDHMEESLRLWNKPNVFEWTAVFYK